MAGLEPPLALAGGGAEVEATGSGEGAEVEEVELLAVATVELRRTAVLPAATSCAALTSRPVTALIVVVVGGQASEMTAKAECRHPLSALLLLLLLTLSGSLHTIARAVFHKCIERLPTSNLPSELD